MGALGTTAYADDVASRQEAEREELEWLLTSGALGRSGNLTRVLRYVCREYFEGRADQIKEYAIAVEALGRRPTFDPQTDTIVRVTVHALRKRLTEIYQHEAAGRPVRLILPPGHYAPSFVHQPHEDHEDRPDRQHEVQLSGEGLPPQDIIADEIAAAAFKPTVSIPSSGDGMRTSRVLSAPLLLGIVLLVIASIFPFWVRERATRTHPADSTLVSSPLPVPTPQPAIHALMGARRAAYVDHSGITWTNGNYCQSGTNVSVPNQRIDGTEDTPLYLGGVRGIVHCAFPVPDGLYEMRFHFAEVSDTPVPTHNTSFSINYRPAQYVDVTDEAGGRDIATSVIVTGVTRESDGFIHLDYVSEVSLLNAVEILPAPSARQLPIRIVASSSAYTDNAKQLWDSDRYFSGGRYSLHLKGTSVSSLGIYQSSRVGRFRYNIPAVPHAHYRVSLYFREPWFRKDNGGMGGPGSRIFDVACNGIILMKNFDILAEGDSVVKTFEHIQANADGRIELYFMPVMNYAAVSAIEILPED